MGTSETRARTNSSVGHGDDLGGGKTWQTSKTTGEFNGIEVGGLGSAKHVA